MLMLGEFLGVTLGVVLTALGLDLFLVPNKIAAGGVSGLATVIHYLTGAPVGMTMLALNVPLFAMGIYRLGLKFGFRSLYGTISLSMAVDAMAPYLPVPTHDPLLASIFGGVLTGLGLGVVFRYRGTTGGTDLAAAILRTYTGANVGQLLFLVDGMVVLFGGITFKSWELGMYALITIFVTAWLIDLVQEGISYTKAFFIISQKVDEIAAAVLKELNRGATALKGRGMYTGRERDVLLVVVNRSEVTRLKELIYKVDRGAFVILADVHEVLGEGFKEWRPS
ncbi:YitT family protein [Desulfofundulus sp.]|uniref:YitT family protein n=1 Tax=Desulfofundulus sp. TaxID=2282750 RepID=UPI003C74C54F